MYLMAGYINCNNNNELICHYSFNVYFITKTNDSLVFLLLIKYSISIYSYIYNKQIIKSLKNSVGFGLIVSNNVYCYSVCDVQLFVRKYKRNFHQGVYSNLPYLITSGSV